MIATIEEWCFLCGPCEEDITRRAMSDFLEMTKAKAFRTFIIIYSLSKMNV
jgi:hypothetical protein